MRGHISFLFWLAGSAFVLTACTISPQILDSNTQFSATPLATDVYRVSIDGDAFTDGRKVQEMAIVRAAELTLEKGYQSFVVQQDTIQTRREFAGYSPGSSSHNQSIVTSAEGVTTFYLPKIPFYVNKTGGSLVIKMFKDDEGSDHKALDATSVVKRYKAKSTTI